MLNFIRMLEHHGGDVFQLAFA